ncbi:MAG: pectate lyase [Vicinamibacterales bacterium]|nr:pectate lyase [Vicinamibacterales bacterium]
MRNTQARYVRTLATLAMLVLLTSPSGAPLAAQEPSLEAQALDAMTRATKYMVERVSTNGGYVWDYLPDLSRRWGEMEAYDTMIWVQPPGTTSMGHLFLDAHRATGAPEFLRAAEKAARAIIWGQLPGGGWNYIVDFAGDRSLKAWYGTIGKNGWRLEEFQHYYGNATFDDDVTSDAAKFLLRMYLETLDPQYKPALDKAINFVLESQYPNGGWPQRYPLKFDFSHHGKPDYTSFVTFNDDVVWENVDFLIQCYVTLGEERLLDPIHRGMHLYRLTQHGAPQAGWALQYTLDLKPAGARTYEPNALLPGLTAAHIRLLGRFYRLTGDRRFLDGIPAALDWLDASRLPAPMTDGGKYTHPVFVEIGTDKPLFVHRKGSNVAHGFYYVDHSDALPNVHYGMKSRVDVAQLRQEYAALSAMTPEDASNDSPLLPGRHRGALPPQRHYDVKSASDMASAPNTAVRPASSDADVRRVIAGLDSQDRWLVAHANTSHPYAGDGVKTEPTDAYASTLVGDETDTSCFRDGTDQLYISTRAFIRNMTVLIDYVQAARGTRAAPPRR